MERSSINNQQWFTLISLFKHTKELLLLAEENELQQWKGFIQPFLEERSALDHLMRGRAVELGAETSPSPDYVTRSYGRAIGHLYRAFFDTADWLGILLREKIIALVQPYDNQCITDVMPEYYERIRPAIEQMNAEFSQFRAGKDICTDDGAIIGQVSQYRERIELLFGDYRLLVATVPAFEEYKRKQRWRNPWLIGIAIAVLGVILGILLPSIVNWLRAAFSPERL